MKRVFLGVLIFLCLVFALSQTSADLVNGYCLRQEITGIEPVVVDVGEEFSVGMQIQSCGDEIAKNVRFEFTRVSPSISINEYAPVEIVSMGCSECEKFYKYNMKVSKDASPGDYIFETRLSYGDGKSDTRFIKEQNFTVKVQADEAKLNIASLKIEPSIPKKGESVSIIARVENFEEGDADSVKAELESEFAGSKKAYLGQLKSGEDGPLSFFIIPEETGQQRIPIKVYYSDDYGEKVLEDAVEFYVEPDKSKTDLLIYLIVGFSLFLIAYFVWKNQQKKFLRNKKMYVG